MSAMLSTDFPSRSAYSRCQKLQIRRRPRYAIPPVEPVGKPSPPPLLKQLKDSGFVWTIQVWVILVCSFGNRAPETRDKLRSSPTGPVTQGPRHPNDSVTLAIRGATLHRYRTSASHDDCGAFVWSTRPGRQAGVSLSCGLPAGWSNKRVLIFLDSTGPQGRSSDGFGVSLDRVLFWDPVQPLGGSTRRAGLSC